jgi:hypothetical protein
MRQILEVDDGDRTAARAAISEAVEALKERWIPVHLIGEAMGLELLLLSQTAGSEAELAAMLRRLARAVEAPQPRQ